MLGHAVEPFGVPAVPARVREAVRDRLQRDRLRVRAEEVHEAAAGDLDHGRFGESIAPLALLLAGSVVMPRHPRSRPASRRSASSRTGSTPRTGAQRVEALDRRHPPRLGPAVLPDLAVVAVVSPRRRRIQARPESLSRRLPSARRLRARGGWMRQIVAAERR